MEQVGARVVAHRPGAALGVDDRAHGLPDLQATVQPAAMHDEPADGPLRVAHVDQRRAAPGLAEGAAVAYLPAALRVEGRPVEDDLGLARAGQLAVLLAVAQDRDDARLGWRSWRSRGTRCRRRDGAAPRTAM